MTIEQALDNTATGAGKIVLDFPDRIPNGTPSWPYDEVKHLIPVKPLWQYLVDADITRADTVDREQPE